MDRLVEGGMVFRRDDGKRMVATAEGIFIPSPPRVGGGGFFLFSSSGQIVMLYFLVLSTFLSLSAAQNASLQAVSFLVERDRNMGRKQRDEDEKSPPTTKHHFFMPLQPLKTFIIFLCF